MKRMFAALILLTVFFASGTMAAEKKYTTALVLVQGKTMNSQYKSISNVVFKFINKQTGIILEPLIVQSDEALLAALKKKKAQIVFTFQEDIANEVLFNYGFDPLISYRIFGRDAKTCLYAKKDKAQKGLESLKGMRALTYGREMDYYNLRELLGAPPEDFFKSLKPMKDGLSSLYALALDEADVVFLLNSNIDYMKITNPGPLKGVREIACTREYAYPLAFYSKAVPEADAESLKKAFIEAVRAEDLKEYRSILQMTKFKIIGVKKEDFTSYRDLCQNALKSGWDNSYRLWSKYSEK